MKVLFVSGNTQLTELARGIFHRMHISSEIVQDGEHAVYLLSDVSFDVDFIIVDNLSKPTILNPLFDFIYASGKKSKIILNSFPDPHTLEMLIKHIKRWEIIECA